MGVLTFEDETVSVVAPARLYKALVKDADTLIPKVIDPIQSVEIVEGNGGPGTIKKLTFTEGLFIYITNYTHNILNMLYMMHIIYNVSYLLEFGFFGLI